MRQGILYPLVIAAGLLGLVYWAMSPTVVSTRYRLTLNAEVDGQPKFGSGVIEVTYEKLPPFDILAENPFKMYARGEAFVLDLGDKGKIFALPTNPFPPGEGTSPMQIISVIWSNHNVFEDDIFPLIRRVTGKRDVRLNQLPMLVRFRDINEPSSIEEITPENLEPYFGSNVKLTGATIEITDDAVTTGILDVLPWLRDLGYASSGGCKPIGTISKVVLSGKEQKPVLIKDTISCLDFIRGQ